MAIPWETLVPFAAFLAMALGSWTILTFFADRPVDAERRLKRLMSASAADRGGAAMARPISTRCGATSTDA